MAMGSVQTIFVCANSYFSQAPCPAGQGVTTMSVYALDPSQASNFEAQFAPFDYAQASALFGLGFTSVLGLFLVARSAGTILNFIRGHS